MFCGVRDEVFFFGTQADVNNIVQWHSCTRSLKVLSAQIVFGGVTPFLGTLRSPQNQTVVFRTAFMDGTMNGLYMRKL
jgi:hypothetical protein